MSTTGPYRKVALCMWQDRRFRALSPAPPSGQTLWIALIAGEHTTLIPGLSRVGEHGLAESLGWDIRAFRAMWTEVALLGMAKAEWAARVVWVPNAIRYNPPENPNVVKSWARVWSEIPECSLKDSAAEVLLAHMRSRGEGFVQAFVDACPSPHAPKRYRKVSPVHQAEPSRERSRKRSAHGLANQEQEQEQEQEQAAAAPEQPQAPVAPAESEPDSVPPLHVVDEGGPRPPLTPSDVFRQRLAERLARTALHPVGGGAVVLKSLEAALERIPVEEAVEACADRVFDAVAEGRRQPGTLAYFVQVLADLATERALAPAEEPEGGKPRGIPVPDPDCSTFIEV